MPEYLFVGGPLHGQRILVPEGLTTYRHGESLEPHPGESWPPVLRMREFVYWRRGYVRDGERRVSFSLDEVGDADLLDALARA